MRRQRADSKKSGMMLERKKQDSNQSVNQSNRPKPNERLRNLVLRRRKLETAALVRRITGKRQKAIVTKAAMILQNPQNKSPLKSNLRIAKRLSRKLKLN
jgi:hypothetical protein